ncbi:MAG: DNA translocase FtsK 4TM domain-containing protein, partial [bacterium]
MGVFSLNRILRESIAVVCLAGAAFAVVSLASYHPGDPSLNTAWGGVELTPLVWRNHGGRVGAYLADALAQTFGVAAFVLPLVLAVCAVKLFRRTQPARLQWALLGGAGLLTAGTALLNLYLTSDPYFDDLMAGVPAGGAVGYAVAHGLSSILNTAGATIVAGSMLVIAFLLVTQATVSGIAMTTLTGMKSLWSLMVASAKKVKLPRWSWKTRAARPEVTLPEPRRQRLWGRSADVEAEEDAVVAEIEPQVIYLDEKELGLSDPDGRTKAREPRQPSLDFSRSPRSWKFPPLSLLDEPPAIEVEQIQEDLLKRAEILEMKLRDFGVEGRVTQVLPGPVVTMYE